GTDARSAAPPSPRIGPARVTAPSCGGPTMSGAAMSLPLGDPLLCAVIDGKYQIAERLGAGGMGTVYKAIHVSLGAPRALKVMRRELAGDSALAARFRSEARLAEGLRHPHLVALYDFGQLPGGGWYIVSEFVAGATV